MGIHLLRGAGAFALALALTLSIVQPFSFFGSRSQRLPFQLLMNKDERIEAFYTSWAWRKCRAALLKDRGGLCEKCLARGIIEAGSKDRPLEVHHKIPLTAENVNDPKVALNWDNLQLLCKDCHEEERDRVQKRWRCDAAGKVEL